MSDARVTHPLNALSDKQVPAVSFARNAGPDPVLKNNSEETALESVFGRDTPAEIVVAPLAAMQR